MIGLIVARSKNNVIGKNGNIPWKIKGALVNIFWTQNYKNYSVTA